MVYSIKSSQFRSKPGFSLVEILIVVSILGILAAMVIPRFANATEQAKAATALANARQVQTKINEYESVHGEWPATIDADWFAGGRIPRNPWAPDAQDPLFVEEAGTATHPRVKYFLGDRRLWYNSDSGRFRVLVPLGSSAEEVIEMYNEANGSEIAVLTQTED